MEFESFLIVEDLNLGALFPGTLNFLDIMTYIFIKSFI